MPLEHSPPEKRAKESSAQRPSSEINGARNLRTRAVIPSTFLTPVCHHFPSVLLSLTVLVSIDTFSFHFPVPTSASLTEEWLLPSVSLCFCHQGTMPPTKPPLKCHKDLVSRGTLMTRRRWSGVHPISLTPLAGPAIKPPKGHIRPEDTVLCVP